MYSEGRPRGGSPTMRTKCAIVSFTVPGVGLIRTWREARIMNRRLAILAILGSLFIVPAPLQPLANAQPGDLPLIDAHDHLQGAMLAERLISLMDQANVTRMVLMALTWDPERGSDQQALDYARKYPGRSLPFVAFQRPGILVRDRWLQPDNFALNLLNEVEGKLRVGGFFGLGEILLRHYNYSIPEWGIQGGVNDEVDIPPNSPLMSRIAELATRYRVPLLIHAEGEPLVVEAMDHFLMSYPNTRVIWAHNCGRSSAPIIRRFLANHANLYCDLAGMTDIGVLGYGAGGPRSEPWTFLVWNKEKRVFPDMKATFETFADRFLGVGADSAHYPEWQYFVGRIDRYRLLLSQLSPATAKRMAHENAERLFGLPPSVR